MIEKDYSRDSLIDQAGLTTIKGLFFKEGDTSPQDVFARTSEALAMGDKELAQRLYNYSSKLWLSYATPLLANAPFSKTALPISCNLTHVGDSISDLTNHYTEISNLSTAGAGIGSYYGKVRSIGSHIGKRGKASGVIPYIKIEESTLMGFHQAGTRRGMSAIYLDIPHPEITEFISVADKVGGDEARKARNLYTAVVIDDKFMHALEDGLMYDLVDPHSKEVIRQVDARDLWDKILTQRLKNGHPYIMYSDNVNKNLPLEYINQNLKVSTSNLCVTEDTYVLTKVGNVRIKDLVGHTVEIWNGYEWSEVTPMKTSDSADIVQVEFSNGEVLKCTLEHKFYIEADEGVEEVAAKDLVEGMSIPIVEMPIIDHENMNTAYSIANYLLDEIESGITKCTILREYLLHLRRYVVSLGFHAEVKCLNPLEEDENLKTYQLVVSDAVIKAIKQLRTTIHAYGLDRPTILQQSKIVTRKKTKVVAIKKCPDKQETYCFTEPKRHTAIFNGIYTKQCSEITLATAPDRTAVCCLSSLNVEKIDEWKHDKQFIEDVVTALDNALTIYTQHTEGLPAFANSRHSVMRERAIGIGMLGWHYLLQKENIPFDSKASLLLINGVGHHIKSSIDKATRKLAVERGASLDSQEFGNGDVRNSLTMAVAPNATSSVVCGTSPSIEPMNSNVFWRKTTSVDIEVRNKYLQAYLESIGMNTANVWLDIAKHGGSVQHLDFIDDHTKNVFKTAFEIDQRWLVMQAAERQKYIDQAQSLNLFFQPDVQREYISAVHYLAWKLGVKTLYYLRSAAPSKAGGYEHKSTGFTKIEVNNNDGNCLACEG